MYHVAIIYKQQSINSLLETADEATAVAFYADQLATNFTPMVATTPVSSVPGILTIARTLYEDMSPAQQVAILLYSADASMIAIIYVATPVVLLPNIVIGDGAGASVGALGPIIAIGQDAGAVATKTNTLIGYNAGIALTTGAANCCIGSGVAKSLTTTSSNTLLGEGVGVGYIGSSGVAIGSSATKLGTTSTGNVVVGAGVAGFALTTGSLNVLMGMSAGSSMSTGGSNVVIGNSAGTGLSTASYNVCVGANARSGTSSTGYNTVMGYGAATSISTGNSNIVIGASAGLSMQSGNNSICIGKSAKMGTTLCDNNVIIGASAGTALTTSASNILIGYRAGNVITNTGNNICIGNVGVVGDSGSIRIGTSAQHTSCNMQGIYGVTATGGIGVFIDVNGNLGTISSSLRYKKNVKPITDDVVARLYSMPVVSFQYKAGRDTDVIYGMIAEDIAKIDLNLVAYNSGGEIDTIKYHTLVPMLVACVQELRREIDLLKNK